MREFNIREWSKQELIFEVLRRQLDEMRDSDKEKDRQDYHSTLFTPSFLFDMYDEIMLYFSEEFDRRYA